MRTDHRIPQGFGWALGGGVFAHVDAVKMVMPPNEYKPDCDCSSCEDFRREPNLLAKYEDWRQEMSKRELIAKVKADRQYHLVGGSIFKPGWVAQRSGVAPIHFAP